MGVVFNDLYAITIIRWDVLPHFLERSNNLNDYMQRLYNTFNPAAACNMMCRSQLSVGCDGLLYDCDFNQAAHLPIEAILPFTDLLTQPIKIRQIVLLPTIALYCRLRLKLWWGNRIKNSQTIIGIKQGERKRLPLKAASHKEVKSVLLGTACWVTPVPILFRDFLPIFKKDIDLAHIGRRLIRTCFLHSPSLSSIQHIFANP